MDAELEVVLDAAAEEKVVEEVTVEEPVVC